MQQVVAVTRPGALDEGDALCLLTVGGAHQLAAGGTARIGHALELDAGDDVGDAVVAIGLDLGRVVGFPAGRPDNSADRHRGFLCLHIEINGAVLASGLGFG